MYHKKSWIAVLSIGTVIGIVLILKFYLSKPRQWDQVTIATATQGGTYHLLGDELAGILERLPAKPIRDANAAPTSGAVKNIELLMDPNSEANVAFVMKSALLQASRENPETWEALCILARLYMDVVQIVVRSDTNIETTDEFVNFFQENKDRKIFIGPERSGTRLITTQILNSIGFSEEDYTADDATQFSQAADRLIGGELDAAFFMAGTPTQAVQRVLESGKFKLLSLEDEFRRQLSSEDLGLEDVNIPANFYPNQPDSVQTVSTDVFLVCRNDLDKDLAFVILEALFDNITDLLLVHAKAQDIKLTDAFEVPEGFNLHPGAAKLRDKEQDALLIATGALNGKYYKLGRMIELLLEERGIRSSVMQTDGSLENSELLRKRSTIAIMQYDAALASRIGKPEIVYHEDLSDVDILPVGNIQRIATLHEEQVHVVMCRDKLAQIEMKLKLEPESITTLSKLAEAIRKLPQEQLRVCLGPPNSASQVIAQAILKHHNIGIQLKCFRQLFLSVPDMVNRLQNEEIDVAFFVSYVPSEAIKSVLNLEKFQLLSLGAKERAKMTGGGVFTASIIEPGRYGCQRKGKPAIQTLATQAVLVTTEKLRYDVKTITKAIFEGEAYLGLTKLTNEGVQKLTKEDMAKHLPSLPLHPDAEQYYQKAKLLPSDPRFDWLRATWTTLGCLVMITTGYRGLIMLRRRRTGNEIGRRILAIPTEASARDSVQRLLKIREEIQERVRRRWWRWGELDKHRWRYLRDLIHDRIGESKENLTRTFVAEIRGVTTNSELDETMRQQRYRSIETCVWQFFQEAELDPSQQKMLRELIHGSSQRGATKEESLREQGLTGVDSLRIIDVLPESQSKPLTKKPPSINQTAQAHSDD
ncbi:MAG: TAXI family TRAP transporter solute-binding subunit [Candidatus Thorarchaeota archaeon]|jgi:TRAP transporter TAXI family solute receptor